MIWLVPAALAEPPPAPAPPPVIEVVPHFREGQVHLFFAGREGDDVYVDGWNAGVLPLTTQLMEGLHRFRVEGKKGRHEIEVVVTLAESGVTPLDLSGAPPPPTAPAPK